MRLLRNLLAGLMLLASPVLALVQPSDFTYLGAFDVTCSESWCTWGQRGLEIADGGSALWMTGHDNHAQVVKIGIPPIGGTAPKLSGPTSYMGSCPEDSNWHFAGIEESGGEMRGVCKYWYNVAGNDLNTYYTSPGAAAQHIGPRSPPFQSAKMGAYLFEVPSDFASQYLGGRRLITGFHRQAGALGGSQGPTLMAFDANDPTSALDLVRYRTHYPECTWDDYSTCDLPGYRIADSWEGGTWVRSAAGDAILLVGQKGLGENYYGPGRDGHCSDNSGYHSDPYEVWILFYDPQDIVARLQGTKEPWEVLPYDHMKISGIGGIVDCAAPGGMTFDQESGRLYVVNKGQAGNGQPKIHIWQVDSEPPPDPVCGDGNCDPGEDYQNCPADCPPPPVCGDGNCDPGEDPTNCPADCQAPPTPPDLLAHYEFNEGSGTVALDSSGNGHTGTLVNGPLWVAGPALDFDGANDYVDLGDLDPASGEMTLMAFVRPDELANCEFWDCRIVSKATGVSTDQHWFMLGTIQSGSDAVLRFRLKTNGVTDTLIAGSGALSDGAMTHVAAVYDGSEMRLYKDGQPVGSTPKSGTIDSSPAVDTWIGGSPGGASEKPWDGVIDDVRLYSKALTQAEIDAIANPPVDPFCGDGNCDAGEDHINCPADCEAPDPVCGDGVCEAGEEDCIDCCPTCPACDTCCPTPEPCDSCCPTPPACDSCCPTCPPLPPTLECDPTTEWTMVGDVMEMTVTWDCVP